MSTVQHPDAATSAPPVLRLAGELTVYHATELKQALFPLPAGNAPVEIDLANVSEIDTAGVQLLLLLRREALALGRGVRLIATAAAVDEALKLLDLHSLFHQSA